MHFFVRNGVLEADFSGMQHESISGLSVQSVADDRRIETVWVRSMHTELVCAACKRIEIDEHCSVLTTFAHHKACDGRFAVLAVHHLSRTIVWIRKKG